MTRLLFAISAALTVGGFAGLTWFARWLAANTTFTVEIPDHVPPGMVAAVWAEDGR